MIQELFNRGESNPNVEHRHLAYADLQKKIFVWDVLMGPLQVIGLSQEELQNLEVAEIPDALFGFLTGVMTDRHLHWVRCSITKAPDGEITVGCWLDNQPWEEGMAGLHKLAETWPPLKQMRLQFLIFHPTDHRLPAAEEGVRKLMAAMEKRRRKKWWQFWK